MNLAVSNIAWNPEDEAEIFPVLAQYGVSGIEVAPTKLWPNWEGATEKAAAQYRSLLADRGFVIPSLQAILFGRPEAKLFDSAESRQQLYDHLSRVADLMAGFGATIAVLGAPTQRQRGTLSPEAAFDIAAAFFAQIAPVFTARDACLCIEPNPRDYGCDFVTNIAEAVPLVRQVGHPGFGLHLDAAGMYLAGDDLAQLQSKGGTMFLRHFHASEPFLGDFSEPKSGHETFSQVLETLRYRGWISIEMKRTDHPARDIEQALRVVTRDYANILYRTKPAAAL